MDLFCMAYWFHNMNDAYAEENSLVRRFFIHLQWRRVQRVLYDFCPTNQIEVDDSAIDNFSYWIITLFFRHVCFEIELRITTVYVLYILCLAKWYQRYEKMKNLI